MIRIQTFILLFFLSLLQSQAHQKPWEQSILILVDDNKAVECHFFCSLALLQEKFQWEFIKGDEVNSRQLEQLTGELLVSGNKLLNITEGEEKIDVFIKDISIPLPQNKEGLRKPESYKLVDLDVSLVMLFSITPPVQNFTVNWLIFPDSILKKMTAQGIPVNKEDYDVTLTITGDELKIYKVTSAATGFKWEKNGMTVQDFVLDKEVLTKVKLSRLQIMFTILFCGFLVLFILWILIPGSKIKPVLLTVWTLFFTVPALSVDWTVRHSEEVSALPSDPLKLKTIVSTSLSKLYAANSSSTPQILYDRLESVCREDFLDDAFVQLYKAKVNSPDVHTIVEQVNLTNIKKTAFDTVKCNWYINAFVSHSSHLHAKTLAFSGTLKFSPQNSSWFISGARVIPIQAESAE